MLFNYHHYLVQSLDMRHTELTIISINCNFNVVVLAGIRVTE